MKFSIGKRSIVIASCLGGFIVMAYLGVSYKIANNHRYDVTVLQGANRESKADNKGGISEKNRTPRKTHTMSDSLRAILNNRKQLLSKREAENYLRIVGRNGTTVSVAFLMSRDNSFLNALSEFPDSELALSVIAQFSKDPKVAELAAQNLINMNPDDPKGYYRLAIIQLQGGKVDSGIMNLRNVSEREGGVGIFDDSSYDEMITALKVNGDSDFEAKGKMINNFQLLQDAMMPSAAMRIALRPLLKEWPEDKKAELASQILIISQKNQDQGTSKWSWGTSYQTFNEMTALRYLPQDLEYGDNSTVAERYEDLKKEVQIEVENEKREIEILSESNNEVIGKYLIELETNGAMAARKWLLEESPNRR